MRGVLSQPRLFADSSGCWVRLQLAPPPRRRGETCGWQGRREDNVHQLLCGLDEGQDEVYFMLIETLMSTL